MLGKNNLRQQKLKNSDKAERYGIKKLSVGVVSVLLSSFVFLGPKVDHVSANDSDTTTENDETELVTQEPEKETFLDDSADTALEASVEEFSAENSTAAEEKKIVPSETMVAEGVSSETTENMTTSTSENVQTDPLQTSEVTLAPQTESSELASEVIEEPKQEIAVTSEQLEAVTTFSAEAEPVTVADNSEVAGSLETNSSKTDNLLSSVARQTVTLDISGEQADYSGGYVEVRFSHANNLTISPSQTSGVTAQVVKDGEDTVLRYNFSAGGLKGGSYYKLVYTYKLAGTGNWSNVVQPLSQTNWEIDTKATFYDKNGVKIKDLGDQTISYSEALNGAGIGTAMSGQQVVGYDINKDGIIDEANKGQVSFYVYTGARLANSNAVGRDTYSAGTGIFNGRFVNGLGKTPPGEMGIAPVTSYRYDIPLQAGMVLSDASKALGWYEDSTGYHLDVTRATNPLLGGDTATIDTYSNYVPIIFDIKENTNVSDLVGNKALEVTGTYTKEDGTVYSNVQSVNYSLLVPNTVSQQGVVGVAHNVGSDTEIIRPHGQAVYQTMLALGNTAETDTEYSLDNYTLTVRTNNENEFFRSISVGGRNYASLFKNGGVIEAYSESGELLGTFSATSQTSIKLDESKKIKEVRYVFKGIDLNKDSTIAYPPSSVLFTEQTFFGDWENIYNDSTITQLESSTTATLVNEPEKVNSQITKTTLLERVIYNVQMATTNDMIATATKFSAGFTESYTLTNVATGRSGNQNEKGFATYTGKLYQAFLLDPELKLSDTSQYTIYYNYNDTGRDLYVEKAPILSDNDPIFQNVVMIANDFVPNGVYNVTKIGFWETEDPNLVAQNGLDLGNLNGIEVTTKNSTTSNFNVTLAATQSSGVISKVKPHTDSQYSWNTNQHEAKDELDFELQFNNIANNDLTDVKIITSLPRVGDTQLDSSGKKRNSQFDVYLTKAVTPPAGFKAVYTTAIGTAENIDKGQWLEADQVTDWSKITAIKFIATDIVKANSVTTFVIDDVVISGKALEGQKAYLSTAASSSGGRYIESNNVSIGMKDHIDDGTLTINYVDESGNVISPAKILQNDIGSDYDVSAQEEYYPQYLTDDDGFVYKYVKTSETSAPATGSFTESPQEITHIYKLVPQKATFVYQDVTGTTPVQLEQIDETEGDPETPIDYLTQTRIDKYLKQGYELVSNDFEDGNTVYDKDTTNDQNFTIKLRQRVVPIDETTTPGQAVDPGNANTPVYPETVKDLETLTKVVTRTIEYKYLTADGSEASVPVIQTATFTRTATVNLVTGVLEYSEWEGSDKFEQVDSPIIPGYTADRTNVPELTPTGDDADQNVVVIYTPNEQKVTVTYLDETTGQTLETASLTGKSDQDVDYTTTDTIKKYTDQGYELVSDDYDPATVYDRDDQTDQTFTVVLKHKLATVTPDDPTDPKTGAQLELTKTITRTIEYKYLTETGAEVTTPVIQTVTFTRTATVDLVTGETTYSDWNSDDSYPEVISPTILGYTPDQASVPELTPISSDTDSQVVVIYQPNDQRASVDYIDETTGQTLEVVYLKGQSDQPLDYMTAETIEKYTDQGYELVSDGYDPDAIYDRDDQTDQNFKVILRHKIADVTPDDPTDPKTGAQLELTKTITRTIEYRYLTETGEEVTTPVVQTATFTRTAKVDLVTGETTYSDWSGSDSYPEVISPTIPGYTPDQASVSEVTPTGADEDSQVIVIYQPNEQRATVDYLDETTGQTLETAGLTGRSDQPLDYTTAETIKKYTDQGYELVSDGYDPAAIYDHDDQTDQNFKVVLRHKIADVTPDDPTDPKTGAQLELTKTITRTIEYRYLTETGEEVTTPVVQTVSFTRTAKVDLVTGETTYSDWSGSDSYPEVISPPIPGYTPDQASVPELTPTSTDTDSQVLVIYQPNEQKATVDYLDETTGQTLETAGLTGRSDQPLNYVTAETIKKYTDQGYELVSDGFDPAAVYDRDDQTDQNFKVVLRHKIADVTPDDPTDPKTGAQLELTKTITRTIEYKYLAETGEEVTTPVVQTVTFTRTAKVDLVTGETTYTDWSSDDSYPEVISPTVPGYTPDQASVAEFTPTSTDENSQVIVIYQPNDQRATVDYLDETTGQTLETAALTGKSDQPLNYTTTETLKKYTDQGYELVSDGYDPDAVYDRDDQTDQNFKVILRHKIAAVTPEDPTDPKTGEQLELTKTITRTIEYRYLTETGEEVTTPVVQTVTFTRTATVDLVTGETTYSDWSSDASYPEVISPTVPGYTPDQARVPALTPTGADENSQIVVIYQPNEQKATVDYIDETTGQMLETADLTGKSEQPLNYTTTETLKKYTDQGYELVSDGYDPDAVYDRDDQTDQNFKVILRHKIAAVTPDEPTDPKTGAQLELTKTITRTIEYKYLTETGEEVTTPVVQTATFTRTAKVDLVTGETTYSDWSSDASYPEVISPTVPGYTPDQARVPVLTPTGADENIQVVVIYQPNEQRANIDYIDETTGQTLETAGLTGKSEQPLNYTTTETLKKYTDQGYELVSDGYDPDAVYDRDDQTDQNFKVILRHKIVAVTPDEPTDPKTGAQLELTKTITRTIEYKYLTETGEEVTTPVVQTATFTRTATVDLVTGDTTYTDWSSGDNYPEVVSPTILGYTPEQARVPELTPVSTDPDSRVVVIYRPNEQRATIDYIDETTGQTLETTSLTGKSEQPLEYTTAETLKKYTDQGYELVSDGYAPDAVYDRDDQTDQNFKVILRHKIATVTPDEPTDPKTGTQLELTKTITRTIEYRYLTKTGEEVTTPVIQTVTFTRTATVDLVTGAVTYSVWSGTGAFPELVSPAIPGYHASILNIPLLTPTVTDEDSRVIVIYTLEQKVRDEGNGPKQEGPARSAEEAPAEQTNEHLSAQTTRQLETKTQTLAQGATLEQQAEAKDIAQTKDVLGEQGAKSETALPETGENDSAVLGFIGMLLGTFGISLGKKRKKDQPKE